VFRGKLGAIGVVFPLFCIVNWVVADVGRECGRHRSLLETRSVGGRLSAQLRQIQIGASFVADIHRLVESALRPEAVEDDTVDTDRDDLHDNLNDGADE